MTEHIPTLPPTPMPALVINISLPMVIGREIRPQPLWTESQLKDYAQQYAQQFERAAAALALELAEQRAEMTAMRAAVVLRKLKKDTKP